MLRRCWCQDRVRFNIPPNFNADGEVLTGKQIIDGTEYVFVPDGHVADGVIGYDGNFI